jgi:hypothetical protein
VVESPSYTIPTSKLPSSPSLLFHLLNPFASNFPSLPPPTPFLSSIDLQLYRSLPS